MMLMTKFGKFKLRLIATINLGVLLSIFNIASTTSNYWIRFKTKNAEHVNNAGLWRTCSPQGDCLWQNGIINNLHTFWSIFVRVFISFGTILNILVVVFLILALFYKTNKRSRVAIQIMEWANCMLIGAFAIILIGFGVFISTSTNFSLWLHIISMIFMIFTSNMVTRTFATLYFKNTRSIVNTKSVETAISTAKIPCDPEEKIALNEVNEQSGANNNLNGIEMNKISENVNGSKEALISVAVENSNGAQTNETSNGISA